MIICPGSSRGRSKVTPILSLRTTSWKLEPASLLSFPFLSMGILAIHSVPCPRNCSQKHLWKVCASVVLFHLDMGKRHVVVCHFNLTAAGQKPCSDWPRRKKVRQSHVHLGLICWTMCGRFFPSCVKWSGGGWTWEPDSTEPHAASSCRLTWDKSRDLSGPKLLIYKMGIVVKIPFSCEYKTIRSMAKQYKHSVNIVT